MGADEERHGLERLAGLFDELGEDLGEVRRQEADGATEYLREGRPFASIAGSVASFRLRPDVAQAAARTPDAAPSPKAPEWVVFAPVDLDRQALDRALAWFESAWRHAAE